MTSDSASMPLIPDPLKSWEQGERFHHRDLVDMEADVAWAEAHLVTSEIARRTYFRQRNDVIYGGGGLDGYVTTLDWLHERLAQLNALLRRKAA